MYKIGNFLIWWVGYFPDQNFIEGNVFYMMTIGYFHGPCIDNLGSMVILRGGGILYIILPENSIKKLNCTNAKKQQ